MAETEEGRPEAAYGRSSMETDIPREALRNVRERGLLSGINGIDHLRWTFKIDADGEHSVRAAKLEGSGIVVVAIGCQQGTMEWWRTKAQGLTARENVLLMWVLGLVGDAFNPKLWEEPPGLPMPDTSATEGLGGPAPGVADPDEVWREVASHGISSFDVHRERREVWLREEFVAGAVVLALREWLRARGWRLYA